MDQDEYRQAEAAEHEDLQVRRREALRRIAQGAAYAAPATLLITSMEASACSLTC